MKVFISWSGKLSKAIAEALRDWLEDGFHSVEPFFSEHDLGKGTRWSPELAAILEATSFGIICLTPENVDSPWLNFEAGAISKSVQDSHVCPLLFRLAPTDVSGPLSQFQATQFGQVSMQKLMHDMNSANEDSHRVSHKGLQGAFDKWWPDLEERITEILESTELELEAPERSNRELLEEVLSLSRKLDRDFNKSRSEQNHRRLVDALMGQRLQHEVGAETGGILSLAREQLRSEFPQKKAPSEAVARLYGLEATSEKEDDRATYRLLSKLRNTPPQFPYHFRTASDRKLATLSKWLYL